MALADIKQKILAEAQAQADKITAAADKTVSEKLAAAQKIVKQDRQKANAQLDKERGDSLQQRRQLLAMESEQSALALKRETLRQVLDSAVEKITQKKLKEFCRKIFQGLDLTGARILAGQNKAPVESACKELGVNPEIILQKDWPLGRLEIDYGKSRLDCSVALYARELSADYEAELAGRLWA